MSNDRPLIVDGLPFVDISIDDDEKQRAFAVGLVDDELKTFAPDANCLDYLPDCRVRPFCTELIQDSHEQIATNHHIQQTSNLSELKLSIPPQPSSMISDHELDIWNDCLNQVKIKLEYRQRQLTNLELLKNYGLPAWQQYISEMEKMERDMNQELDRLERLKADINSKRKSDQERVKKSLDVLYSQWDNLVVLNKLLSDELKRMTGKS